MLLKCFLEAGGAVEGTVPPDTWLIERFRTVNLFERRPPVWAAEEARRAASIVRMREIDWARGDLVVLLGRRVADAMGYGRRVWFETWTDGRVRFWLTPHPSGLSRLMNDPEIRKRVGLTLITALEASGLGDTYDSGAC